jgi:hypothetical protein
VALRQLGRQFGFVVPGFSPAVGFQPAGDVASHFTFGDKKAGYPLSRHKRGTIVPLFSLDLSVTAAESIIYGRKHTFRR